MILLIVWIALSLSSCNQHSGGTAKVLSVSAGADQTVEGTQAVSLNASSNAASPSYQWTLTSKPSDSTLSDSSIDNANTANASFIPDVVGSYTLQVKASSGGQNATNTTTVAADDIWHDLGSAGVSASSASYISMTIAPDGTPYIAYSDGAKSGKATVEKYDTSTSSWVDVGSTGFSAGTADSISLAVAPDGTPYIAYSDGAKSGKATVEQYDNSISSWVDVGSAGFTSGTADSISLAIGNDDTPCIAYSDGANSGKATVEQYNPAKSSWVNLGSAGFSAGTANSISLVIPIDEKALYLAYSDGANSGKATVEKYDISTSSWVDVGRAGFSPGTANSTSLAMFLNSNGTTALYLAYSDGANSGKATVEKYDTSTSSWVDVGRAGFSQGPVAAPSLSVAPGGIPCIAYSDTANGGKATVERYNPSKSSWVDIGKAGFSPGAADSISLALALDGTPYLAYRNFANSGKAAVEHLTTIAPQVTHIHPSKYSLKAGSNADISVTFNHAMDQSTLTDSNNFTVTSISGPVTASRMTYNPTTHTETFVPSSPLKLNVMVKLTNAIKDSTGKNFVGMSWIVNSPIWHVVGHSDFSPGQAEPVSLAIAPDGTPYMAYADGANSAKATVKKYDSSTLSWVDVGGADFSPGEAGYPSLAIAPDGTPYIAYSDDANSGKATVEKYDSSTSSWVDVGSADFSPGQALYTSLAIAPDGTPYIAYSDGANSGKATVEQYDSSTSSWVDVGSADFSPGQALYPSLGIAPDGTPYIAYSDRANSGKATVEKYDTSTSTWVNAGSADFSPGQTDCISLATNPYGTPYIAYCDGSHNFKATVESNY